VIEDSTAYRLIKDFYGDRRADRSGVRLIQHIDEGLEIMSRYGSQPIAMEAYAAHPLFQPDGDLKLNYHLAHELQPLVVLYAMEYRNVANAYLSDKITRTTPLADDEQIVAIPNGEIRLSPLPVVNDMLVADKVQNRKDFLRYHAATHNRSLELDFYFRYWLEALEIDEQKYQRLVEGL
jgi:hypothetical protein